MSARSRTTKIQTITDTDVESLKLNIQSSWKRPPQHSHAQIEEARGRTRPHSCADTSVGPELLPTTKPGRTRCSTTILSLSASHDFAGRRVWRHLRDAVAGTADARGRVPPRVAALISSVLLATLPSLSQRFEEDFISAGQRSGAGVEVRRQRPYPAQSYLVSGSQIRFDFTR